MMNGSLIAIAGGFAELGWQIEIFAMIGCLLVSGIIGLAAILKRSGLLAATAFTSWLLVSLAFRPWHYFSPFPAKDLQDPDVRDFVGDFQTAGILWIIASAMILISVLVASLLSWRSNDIGQAKPSTIEI